MLSGLELPFELVTLKSGAKSLRSLERKETFHPGIGPLAEARLLHVEQQNLLVRARASKRFVIWDVGFGAAANAIAAIEALASIGAQVEIHSFDQSLAPIAFALQHAEELAYPVPHRALLEALIRDGQVQKDGLRWHFHHGDFRTMMNQQDLPSPQSVFYDPYSPATNREMWTLDHFTAMHARVADADCLLTTYTRSTAVRVTLLLAGFFVGTGREIGEKAETTVAATKLDLLRDPLPRDWLKRVQISRNGAPMRDPLYSIVPILADDFQALAAHAQFQPQK